MKQSYELVMKDVTGATEVTVDSLRLAVLESMSFLHPILDKVVMGSGTLLYPYTPVPSAEDSAHTIKGLELTRTTDTIVRTLVKETIEDANPSVGTEQALNTIMAQQAAQKIEKSVVDTMLLDVSISQPVGSSADWAGVEASLLDMGTEVFNTVGSFIVVVSLAEYLSIIRDADFERASDVLKDKLKFIVSAGIPAGSMLVMHEYGVAGSVSVATLEEDSSPSSDSADLILPYKVGLGYDTAFVRKVV